MPTQLLLARAWTILEKDPDQKTTFSLVWCRSKGMRTSVTTSHQHDPTCSEICAQEISSCSTAKACQIGRRSWAWMMGRLKLFWTISCNLSGLGTCPYGKGRVGQSYQRKLGVPKGDLYRLTVNTSSLKCSTYTFSTGLS